jgi:hypothetical protein
VNQREKNHEHIHLIDLTPPALIKEGIRDNNVVFAQMIGLCPAAAVTQPLRASGDERLHGAPEQPDPGDEPARTRLLV